MKFAWSRKIKKGSAPATLLSSPQQATRQAAEPEPKHFLVRSELEPGAGARPTAQASGAGAVES